MHLATIKCCSHEFSASDINGKLMSQREVFGKEDKHLYGGNVKRFAPTSCPECEKEYYLWLKPKGQSYRVLTISKRGKEDVDFDKMDKAALRAWLDANHIEYVPQWSEQRLRELAANEGSGS